MQAHIFCPLTLSYHFGNSQTSTKVPIPACPSGQVGKGTDSLRASPRKPGALKQQPFYHFCNLGFLVLL